MFAMRCTGVGSGQLTLMDAAHGFKAVKQYSFPSAIAGTQPTPSPGPHFLCGNSSRSDGGLLAT